MKACKSTNEFQTMVPAFAKAVVEFFNKFIGIYSCYRTLLISSLKLGTSGWRPQTSVFFLRAHNHRREACGWAELAHASARGRFLGLLCRKEVGASIHTPDLSR